MKNSAALFRTRVRREPRFFVAAAEPAPQRPAYREVDLMQVWRKELCEMGKFKFDVAIGNPPYQDDSIGDNKEFAPPIYHLFIQEAYKTTNKVELIHPARFLFNAGSTPKNWNREMLEDPHLKIFYYEQDSSTIFPGTDIKGGIAISYHDTEKNYGPIKVFSPIPEVNDINKKVQGLSEHNLTEIIYPQTKFNLEALYADYPDYENIIGSNGRDKRFRNNIFDKIDLFSDAPSTDADCKILGVQKNKRVWKYIPEKYIDNTDGNLKKWKVFVVRVNGTGRLGEVLSTPVIAKPDNGFTQTFIGIGDFDTKGEAENLLKYIQSKFLRTMLSVLKVTQDNSKETWSMIPLQDFSATSDIDWSQPVAAIDQQLYKKYGLTEHESSFIEKNVKEMA